MVGTRSAWRSRISAIRSTGWLDARPSERPGPSRLRTGVGSRHVTVRLGIVLCCLARAASASAQEATPGPAASPPPPGPPPGPPRAPAPPRAGGEGRAAPHVHGDPGCAVDLEPGTRLGGLEP